MNILYLSYTSLAEPLGESQVLAYLRSHPKLPDYKAIFAVSRMSETLVFKANGSATQRYEQWKYLGELYSSVLINELKGERGRCICAGIVVSLDSIDLN